MITNSTTQGLQTAETLRVHCSCLPTESWEEFNPYLPDIPITDVIRRHDELATASHGRGFWVLDNIAPFRPAQPGNTERAVHLFDPATAYRLANGVVLSWWLGEEVQSASDATLEIMEATGAVVRTLTPAQEGEERDRWAGPALPGTYAVRLTVDGRVAETEVEVWRNPWITDVTDEDIVAQYEFGVRARVHVDARNSAVITIRRVKARLDERPEVPDGDEALIEAAKQLWTVASAVEAGFCQVLNRSNLDPLNFPIKVNNRLANLLSMSERGDRRPGSGMYTAFEIMVDRLEGLLGDLEGVWSEELEEVNAVLRGMGVGEPDVRLGLGGWCRQGTPHSSIGVSLRCEGWGPKPNIQHVGKGLGTR